MKRIDELSTDEKEDLRGIALKSAKNYCDFSFDRPQTLTLDESRGICEDVLWKCYEKFDESKAENPEADPMDQFLHYYRKSLKFRMDFEYLKLGKVIDIPDRNLSYVKSVEAIRHRYTEEHQFPPQDYEIIHYEPFKELVERSRISAQILLDAHKAYYTDLNKVSLDQPISEEEDGFTIGDVTPNQIDEIATADFFMDFHAWLETIDPRHAEAIELKGMGYSYTEIGKEIGVSADTIKNWIDKNYIAWNEFYDAEDEFP